MSKFGIERRLSLIYNLGHNILELCNVLEQILFPTSKTKLHIYYKKLGIQLTSRVAEQLVQPL